MNNGNRDFVIFNWVKGQEFFPTKPFGVPYEMVVIDKNKKQGICVDNIEHIIELWHEGYIEKKNQEPVRKKLASSIASQLQEHVLTPDVVVSLSESDKNLILSAVEGDNVEVTEWSPEVPLYVVSDGHTEVDYNVTLIDYSSDENFIYSLYDLGLIDIMWAKRYKVHKGKEVKALPWESGL